MCEDFVSFKNASRLDVRNGLFESLIHSQRLAEVGKHRRIIRQLID